MMEFIVCIPPICWRGEVKLPTKFPKMGGLTGPPVLEGITGKESGDLFQEGCNFYLKNKTKSEIFNDKNVYKQKYLRLT